MILHSFHRYLLVAQKEARHCDNYSRSNWKQMVIAFMVIKINKYKTNSAAHSLGCVWLLWPHWLQAPRLPIHGSFQASPHKTNYTAKFCWVLQINCFQRNFKLTEHCFRLYLQIVLTGTYKLNMGFLHSSASKESSYNVGRPGFNPRVGKIP